MSNKEEVKKGQVYECINFSMIIIILKKIEDKRANKTRYELIRKVKESYFDKTWGFEDSIHRNFRKL